MSYIGGLDGEEREMYRTMIHHFILRLEEERARCADLVRQLDCEQERVKLLEMQAYGLF